MAGCRWLIIFLICSAFSINSAFGYPQLTTSSQWKSVNNPTFPVPGYSPGWFIETVDSGALGNGSSIALDSNGMPHISYYDFINDDLKYASKTSSGWEIEIVDSAGYVGRFNSIALDSTDKPHISYCSCTNSSCNTCNDLKYAWYDGNIWNIEWADTTGDVGGYTSLALLENKPHISYYDFTNGNLKFAYKDSLGTPHTGVVDNSADDVGRYTSLALGFSNRHISYYNATDEHLMYAYFNGTSWSTQTLDSTTYTGAHSSLDLCRSSSPGGARIAYFSNGDMKYAHKYIFGGWNFVTYNSDAPAGISLALDLNCLIHISYYNMYNGDLKYFYDTSSGFITEIIDNEGDVGDYISSLVLDADGHPHISYYDDSGGVGRLRYAYKGYLIYLPHIDR